MAAPGLTIAYTSYAPAGLPDGSSRGNDELSIYAWDGVQRLTTMTHIFPVAPAAANVQWQLARNSTGQITATTRINDTYAWTGAYTVNRGYTTNGLNQYTVAGGANFGYDSNGNLTSDGANSFTYDPENRLGAASGAHSATLSYDPLGRLWQVTAGSSTTRFLYDGDALVAEYDGAGAMQRRYVHWVGADVPVVSYSGATLAQPTWLHADQQGSIVALSNASGIVTAIDTYDEYGIPGAANAGRFQYTGQAWLAELGMYYYKARIYSPTLGRFMQTDPIGYEGGINLYAYVDNDPVDNEDPSGLSPTNNAPEANTCSRVGSTACSGDYAKGSSAGVASHGSQTGRGADSEGQRRDHAAATAIYGETAGLSPGLMPDDGNPSTPRVLNPRSVDQLAHARRAIGIISERNPGIHHNDGSASRNPIEAAAWREAAAAARTRYTETIPRNAFFIYLRNLEDHPTHITNPYGRGTNAVYIGTFGATAPFINVGGGDVRRGNVVIDIYAVPGQ